MAINPISSRQAYSAPIGTIPTPPIATAKPAMGFDTFERDELSHERFEIKPRISLYQTIRHPIKTAKAVLALLDNTSSKEGVTTRLAMFHTLSKNLSKQGKENLYQQLTAGRLTDTTADDGHSTIRHLYSIYANPRNKGYNKTVVLEETLRLLSKPQTITQKFGPLSPPAIQKLLAYYQSGKGPQIKGGLDPSRLDVLTSATCVASSVMGRMVEHTPSEFCRHIAELTGPKSAFYEKAYADEISPEDPSQARQILSDYGIPATEMKDSKKPGYWIKVNLPYSGVIRAQNQQASHPNGTQGVVESAYQAALTHLVVRTYDPGLDTRVENGKMEDYKGLEEDKKTLMESIIGDNTGVISVTYQFTGTGRASGSDEAYLVGYYRGFEKTTRDLTTAIDSGTDVIVGFTDTDDTSTTGRINMGHEIRVVGYKKSPTGQIIFKVADSDDDIPNYVWRTAQELVPKIHHAGFPAKQARKIWAEINGSLDTNKSYLLPDQRDSQQFQTIATVPNREQLQFLEDYYGILKEDEAKETANKPTEQPAKAPSAPRPQWQPLPPVYQIRPIYPQQQQQTRYYPYPAAYNPTPWGYANNYYRRA